MTTTIGCQGCGKEIHYGALHFAGCNRVGNKGCACLFQRIADANTQHQCSHGPDLMRPVYMAEHLSTPHGCEDGCPACEEEALA